jgi:hypothetical protein
LMALASLCLAMPVAYVGCYLVRTKREPSRFGGTVVVFYSERERDFFWPAREAEVWMFRDGNRGYGWPIPLTDLE